MKNILLSFILLLSIGCKKEVQKTKKLKANYYKNLFTGEIVSKTKFENYKDSIYKKHIDSTLKITDSIKDIKVSFRYFKKEKISDSVIQEFKFDFRINNKYIFRSKEYKKIGMKIPPKNFNSINGKKIKIGGKQEKPTLINLWFINCPGCVAEIPELNRLKEKYADKVNFVSMTFEENDDVLEFLNKKDFDFIHITDVQDYITKIGSHPYPENIFIDKNGYITNIEEGIPYNKNIDIDESIKYFEYLIKKLL